MERFLKILLVEDSWDDVQLIERELQGAGINFTFTVVQHQSEFENAIKTFGPDVILSDHSLPRFNSIDALKILAEHNKQSNLSVPFILVTGTVSEEFAVQTIKAGAADFILKDRLKRLPSAIMNALEKTANETEKARYLNETITSEGLMRQAEQLANFGSWHGDLLTGKYRWSDETFRIYGYEPGQIVPDYQVFLKHVHPDDVARLKKHRDYNIDTLDIYDSEFRIIDRSGKLKHLSSRIQVKRDEDRRAVALIGVNLDITDRVEAELLLRKSEQEYKSLFDRNPDAVYSLDLEGNFTKVNRAVMKLVGLPESRLLTMNFKPLISKGDADVVQIHFESAVRGIPQRYQTKIIGNEGREFIIDVTNIPIVVNGQVVGVHGVAKDITDNVRLQGLLAKAYELARIGGWEIDVATKKATWTAITKELHEVEPDFVPDLETGISFYKEGKDRDEITKAVNEALEFGKSFDVELQIVTAKSNLRWVRAIGEAEFRDGKCVRLYGSFQDIHEKKSAEETIKQTYKEKIAILESVGDAFFAVDRKWTVTYWNRMAEITAKIPRQAIIGQNLWKIYADAIPLAFYDQFHKAVAENQPVHFQEFYPPLNIWVDVSAFPSPAGLSVYFRDITAFKNHVTEIEQKNIRLTEIAWSLSHELRAPLARLMGLVQIVKDYPEHETDLPKTLNMMLKSADDLDKMIREISRRTEDLDS